LIEVLKGREIRFRARTFRFQGSEHCARRSPERKEACHGFFN